MHTVRSTTIGVVIAASAILAAACTSGGAPASAPAEANTSPVASLPPSPAPTPSPSPTPAPTPSPEPTFDRAALGAAYLAIATGVFEESQAIDERFDGATTNDEYAELYAEVARLRREAITAITALEFSPDLADAKARLLDAFDRSATEFEKLAEDVDYDPKDRINVAAADVSASGAEIREALGLPPPATPKP